MRVSCSSCYLSSSANSICTMPVQNFWENGVDVFPSFHGREVWVLKSSWRMWDSEESEPGTLMEIPRAQEDA